MSDQQADKLIIENYGAKNLSKVKKNMRDGVVESKRRFIKKYPYADLSKFEFQVDLKNNGDIDKYTVFYKINDVSSYDITSDAFLNNKEWQRDIRWAKLWDVNGTVQPFTSNPVGVSHKINSFRIYVTNDLFFDADFTDLNIENNEDSADYKDNTYLAALFAAYIATYSCGISTEHFEYSDRTPRIITSIARYHLYYQMRKFIRQPEKMSRFITQKMKSIITTHEPFEYEWTNEFYYGKDSLLGWVVSKRIEGIYVRGAKSVMSKNKVSGQVGISYQKRGEKKIRGIDDYRVFIATKSSGLTNTGQLLFQQSIESYVYCVLGAQASTRWSIVGKGAMSIQTQSVFLKKVEDTIVQNDQTLAIRNMRLAIKDTNVILNMAISRGIILVPSNMIILTEAVAGYNNILTLAGKGMKFGVNDAVNYLSTETGDDTKPTTPTGGTQINTDRSSRTIPGDTATTVPNKPTITYGSDPYLLAVALIGGALVSKYVI